ncbi:Heat shock transcription factor [Entamoeba marina]
MEAPLNSHRNPTGLDRSFDQYQTTNSSHTSSLGPQQQVDFNTENVATAEYLHNCAPFVAKLYSLVNSPEHSHLITWSEQHKGQAFCVLDTVAFSQDILPKHFKHSNISSFVRQLNIYGFHKLESKNGTCFKHENFIKNRPDLLENIKRKKNRKSLAQNQLKTEFNKNGDAEFFDKLTLRVDLTKLQKQVVEMQHEIQTSKMKWADLSRRLDQFDQFLSMMYSNYSSMQTNSQLIPNLMGNYFTGNSSAPMYPNPRRIPEYPQDNDRHRDQSQP